MICYKSTKYMVIEFYANPCPWIITTTEGTPVAFPSVKEANNFIEKNCQRGVMVKIPAVSEDLFVDYTEGLLEEKNG